MAKSLDTAEIISSLLAEHFPQTEGRFVIPATSVELRAMELLLIQVSMAKDALSFIAQHRLPCSHETADTDADSSKESTAPTYAAKALDTIAKQIIDSDELAESSSLIEEDVAAFMDKFFKDVPLPEDEKVQFAQAYRARLLNNSDPRQIITRRLRRYVAEDRTITIPDHEIVDRALHLLTVSLTHGLASLGVVARDDREFSCVHRTIYAGNVESEGNRIYDLQKIAANGLESMADYSSLKI